MKTVKERCRFVVLISGQGSNLRAIVQFCRENNVSADFVKVISNVADAPGIEWAKQQGLPTAIISHRDFASRQAFDVALAELVQQCNPDYVILAGFMRILTKDFVSKFENRLVNIHPSLLPAFQGLHTHARALQMGVGWHGCTVHFVTAELDHGPIIAQAALEVEDGDDEASLRNKVLSLEHKLYPMVVSWLANRQVDVDSTGKVTVRGVASRHLKGYLS